MRYRKLGSSDLEVSEISLGSWLTYSGGYYSQRYSALNQITPANVKNLKLQWVYQSPVAGNWQTTPLVVDGIMYLTQRQNDVVALDAIPEPEDLLDAKEVAQALLDLRP